MSYPKKVYALFPYDDEGKVAGVYVGVSQNLKNRMRVHKNTQNGKGKQDRLHELMRRNGYTFKIIDEVRRWEDGHIEYDWIDYFLKETNFPVFNNEVSLCGANWKRLDRFKKETV